MTIEIERVFSNFVLLRIYKDATRLTSNMRKIGIGSKDGVTKIIIYLVRVYLITLNVREILAMSA